MADPNNLFLNWMNKQISTNTTGVSEDKNPTTSIGYKLVESTIEDGSNIHPIVNTSNIKKLQKSLLETDTGKNDSLEKLKKRWDVERDELKTHLQTTRDVIASEILKERTFPNAFDNKIDEDVYFEKLKAKFKENSTALKNTTFICLSGVYGAGKDTVASCLTKFLSKFDVEIDQIAYASSLKDAVSNYFKIDRNLLDNKDAEQRKWMESIDSDDALFWSASLLNDVSAQNSIVVHHNYDNIDDFHNLTETDIDTKIHDQNFRQNYPGIQLEYNLLQNSENSEEKMSAFVESRKQILRECNDITEVIELTSIESQFIRHIRNTNTHIHARYPISPRKLLEEIGTDIMRKHFSPDLFILSEIRNIIKKAKVNPEKKRIAIVSDARFLNEVILPSKFGAKIIYFYIERPSAIDNNPVFKSLDSFIQNYITERNVSIVSTSSTFASTYKRIVPSIEECRNHLIKLLSDNGNTDNTTISQKLIPDVRWMPILLKHYMRENFSSQFREYNIANGQNISYYRLVNKDADFSDRDQVLQRLQSILQTLQNVLVEHEIM